MHLVDAQGARLGIDDPRLTHALDWVAEQQGSDGRWLNRYAYNHKTWGDIEHQGGVAAGLAIARIVAASG